MFWRILFQMLRGSRGRLAVALVALISGAAVISALINLDLDIGSKLTEEFRTLGANVVILPRDVGTGSQANEQAIAQVDASSGAGRNAAAPLLMNEAEVLKQLGGTQLQGVVAAAP